MGFPPPPLGHFGISVIWHSSPSPIAILAQVISAFFLYSSQMFASSRFRFAETGFLNRSILHPHSTDFLIASSTFSSSSKMDEHLPSSISHVQLRQQSLIHSNNLFPQPPALSLKKKKKKLPPPNDQLFTPNSIPFDHPHPYRSPKPFHVLPLPIPP
jgi:hypothetical protein